MLEGLYGQTHFRHISSQLEFFRIARHEAFSSYYFGEDCKLPSGSRRFTRIRVTHAAVDRAPRAVRASLQLRSPTSLGSFSVVTDHRRRRTLAARAASVRLRCVAGLRTEPRVVGRWKVWRDPHGYNALAHLPRPRSHPRSLVRCSFTASGLGLWLSSRRGRGPWRAERAGRAWAEGV